MLPAQFRSVSLSNWQSAVAKTVRRPDPLSLDFGRPPLDFSDARIDAAAKAAFAVHEGGSAPPPSSPIEHAAVAALGLARALVSGKPGEVIAAKAAFLRYGDNDPFWLECITEFIEHYSMARHSAVPYVKYRTLNDCILPPGTLPERCRIAVISDWGTGDARAQALIEDVALHQPQIVIHLGDIYYACTAMEAKVFEANLVRGLGPATPRLFTLCGNHDMYSGAAPYYSLLKRLGQPASYFCLRNPRWQILALDTGYNDFNPFKKGAEATWIRDRDEGETYSELDWHKDKLVNAGGRRTILMSHHPLFSRNSAISGEAVNGYLEDQFRDYLPELALWLWGHEHNMVVYEPFVRLVRGRCIGAAAVPVSAKDDITSPALELEGKDIPSVNAAAVPLAPEANGGLYQLGYALLDFDGRDARASYFGFDTSTGLRTELYHETL